MGISLGKIDGRDSTSQPDILNKYHPFVPTAKNQPILSTSLFLAGRTLRCLCLGRLPWTNPEIFGRRGRHGGSDPWIAQQKADEFTTSLDRNQG
jgi:hypothetical protein